MNRLPRHKREQIVHLLCEGNSMRSASRIVGVSIMTVMKLLVEMGEEAYADFHDRTVRSLSPSHVECDEAWSYCYAKDPTTTVGNKHEYAGDMWTWVAIDPATKLVIS